MAYPRSYNNNNNNNNNSLAERGMETLDFGFINFGQKYKRKSIVGGSECSVKDIAIDFSDIRVFQQTIKISNFSGNK